MKTRFVLTLACLWLAATPASAQLAGLGLPKFPPVGGVLGTNFPTPAKRLAPSNKPPNSARATCCAAIVASSKPILTASRSSAARLSHWLSEAALSAARAAGFDIIRSDDLGESGALVTLRAPPSLSTRRALRVLREADPNGNSGMTSTTSTLSRAASLRPTMAQLGASSGGPRIGLIDTVWRRRAGSAAYWLSSAASPRNARVPGAHGAAVAALASSAAANAPPYRRHIRRRAHGRRLIGNGRVRSPGSPA